MAVVEAFVGAGTGSCAGVCGGELLPPPWKKELKSTLPIAIFFPPVTALPFVSGLALAVVTLAAEFAGGAGAAPALVEGRELEAEPLPALSLALGSEPNWATLLEAGRGGWAGDDDRSELESFTLPNAIPESAEAERWIGDS